MYIHGLSDFFCVSYGDFFFVFSDVFFSITFFCRIRQIVQAGCQSVFERSLHYMQSINQSTNESNTVTKKTALRIMEKSLQELNGAGGRDSL